MLTINARFLTQNITGVQRFAIEISKELKKIYGNRIRFVAPYNILHHDLARELSAEVIGLNKGHLWEQIDLPLYLKTNSSPLLINLANTAPLFYAKKVVTVYDLAFYHHPEWFSRSFARVYNFLIPRILKKSRRVFTDSEFIKNEIHDIYGIDREKIDVVYGAPADIFKSLDLMREPFALAVGSIDPRKNLKPLIELFARYPEYRLVVVGQQNRVFASMNLENLPDNISFTGYVSDDELVALYNRASVFVYPSLYEGFGIPPLEAQACGCPVICSKMASLPEVGGDSVIYCDPYDKEDMTQKIKMILDDKDRQNELRQKGFENIRRFSWEESAKKMMETIERIK